MVGFRNPEEMDVWKLSNEVALRVRVVVDRAPFRRHEKLRQQMEEAAGSLAELIRHLNRALARQLVSPSEHAEIYRLTKRALGAAIGYIAYLQTAEAPHLPKKHRRGRRRRKNPNSNPNPN